MTAHPLLVALGGGWWHVGDAVSASEVLVHELGLWVPVRAASWDEVGAPWWGVVAEALQAGVAAGLVGRHLVELQEHPGEVMVAYTARLVRVVRLQSVGICRACGCTDADCSGCIQRTGRPCHRVEPDLCSACREQLGPKPRALRDGKVMVGENDDLDMQVDGDECVHCSGGWETDEDDDCFNCRGNGWAYQTTVACDSCGDRVVVAEGPEPVWPRLLVGVVVQARCEDCRRLPAAARGETP